MYSPCCGHEHIGLGFRIHPEASSPLGGPGVSRAYPFLDEISLNRLAAITGPLVAIDARTYNEEAAAREHSRATLNNCLADRLFIRERIARNKVKEDLGNFLRTMHQVSEGTIHDLEKFHDRIVHVAEADLRLN
jgi:hypothetical protein